MPDAILIALIAAGGVVTGSFLTSILNLFQAAANRRAEERKVIYDIASKLALEQWKLDVERTDAFNETLKDGGIYRVRNNLSDFQVPIPHVAQTVRRIVDELERSTLPKSWCRRFQDWRSAPKKKKAEQAETRNP
jgi:hypothetical protein